MRNFIRLVATGAALAATVTGTSAFAATASADATVEILAALSVTKDTDMDFGSIALNAGGDAVLAPNGTLTCNATELVCAATGTAATFTLAGDGSTGVAVTLPASVALTGTGPDLTLVPVSDWTDGTTITTDSTFAVGGTLTVPGGQAAGTYTGNFSVTADYQ